MSRSSARHARPSRLPARLAVTSALGGLLVPLLSSSSSASAAERTAGSVRLSGPAGDVAPGSRVPLTVRLLSGSAYVEGGVVDLQVPEGSGWRTVTRATTGSDGLGRASLTVSRDQRVRAHYRGNAATSAATSSAVLVDVAERGQAVLAEAARHRGAPYRYGATGPRAFDCSGYTRYVYAKARGVSLPHSARAQEDVARRVSKSSARVGDLVFIQDVAGHVGIYAGNGTMWDAPKAGSTVTRRRIWTSNYTIGRI